MDLKNKIALVTGASKGIGAATSIALAEHGARVIINFHSDEKGALRTLEKCDSLLAGSIIVKTDIENDNEVKEMFSKIKETFGKLDILVNNAGIFASSENPVDLKTYESMWSMNFLAQVRVTKYALELMKVGKIVNVTSIHGRLGHGNPSAIAYSSLKAAFDSYTKNLAKGLAPNILVNAIAPGRTLTPMWGSLSSEEEKELGKGQLIERFIEPKEIADGILFLLQNNAVCGEILTLDGGMSLRTLG